VGRRRGNNVWDGKDCTQSRPPMEGAKPKTKVKEKRGNRLPAQRVRQKTIARGKGGKKKGSVAEGRTEQLPKGEKRIRIKIRKKTDTRGEEKRR